MTKQVRCGGVRIGGGAPVSIQSMITAKTLDVPGAVAEIQGLVARGCQIVRLAVPDADSAEAFGQIRRQVEVPLVADIHFDHRLAVAAIRQGADKIRINPGNLGGRDALEAVVAEAKKSRITIRVGVNGGSLEKDLLERLGVCAEALAESALRNAALLEALDFTDIVLSMKASSVPMTYQAYRMVSERSEYPLHIGITEAGLYEDALLKSAVGLGGLLLAGIGDTMRVSVTGDSFKEPEIALKILETAGLRPKAIEFISCPTCGRTRVPLAQIAETIRRRLIADIEPQRRTKGLPTLTVAVMGCEVNGPGEAADADLGVAFGRGRGVIFLKGKIYKTLDEEAVIDEILRLAATL